MKESQADIFLRLGGTQNALQLPFYFFFCFSSVFLDGQTEIIFIFFSLLL